MIHIESKLLTIRGGDDFKKYGDPYDFCLSLFVDGNDAYIFGLCGKFRWSDYAEIREKLLSMGITKAHWERKKNGKTKIVEWK